MSYQPDDEYLVPDNVDIAPVPFGAVSIQRVRIPAPPAQGQPQVQAVPFSEPRIERVQVQPTLAPQPQQIVQAVPFSQPRIERVLVRPPANTQSQVIPSVPFSQPRIERVRIRERPQVVQTVEPVPFSQPRIERVQVQPSQTSPPVQIQPVRFERLPNPRVVAVPDTSNVRVQPVNFGVQQRLGANSLSIPTQSVTRVPNLADVPATPAVVDLDVLDRDYAEALMNMSRLEAGVNDKIRVAKAERDREFIAARTTENRIDRLQQEQKQLVLAQFNLQKEKARSNLINTAADRAAFVAIASPELRQSLNTKQDQRADAAALAQRDQLLRQMDQHKAQFNQLQQQLQGERERKHRTK